LNDGEQCVADGAVENLFGQWLLNRARPQNADVIANNMLWPIVLPVQLTFWIMLSMIVVSTLLAVALKWKPIRVFLGSIALAFVAFIPSCTGIMSVLDARRFGVFQYATYAEVQDFRIYRYLPVSAHSITLEKTAMGHRAKYSISEPEMRDYMDRLWKECGEGSAIARSDLNEGEIVKRDEIEYQFRELGWTPLTNAIRFHSPVQGDGGGAEYFLDASSGTAYHRAGYW
jgi:hypothetical protein